MFPRPAVPCHLQDLVPFLDALPVRRAACLHPGYEDAHVVAAGQPQTNTRTLGEVHDTSVGAVATVLQALPARDSVNVIVAFSRRLWFSDGS